MKTFQNKQYGFEIDIPEDWTYRFPGFLRRLLFGFSKNEFVFEGPGGYNLHILVGQLAPFESEPSFSENVSYFKGYVRRHGYTELGYGAIKIGEKDCFWGRYKMIGGLIVKKYSIIFQRVEYVITCALGLGNINDEGIRYKERRYDEIVSSFRILR